MHGQRGTVGFFPETLVDHGSSSSNAAIEQQVCWNNIQNPIERRLPDCLLSTNDMNIGHENSIAREEHELIRWSFGEPNSSGTQCEAIHNERKMNHGWPSSMSAPASSGPRLEERQYEQKAVVGQSSNSSTVPQDINLNASLIDNDYDSCQVIEQSNLYKPSGPENERMLTIVGPEAFLHSSGSCGYAVGDNDSRPGCSYEGSKRKAIEGNAGKSSSSGSSHKFHRAENSVRRGVPSSCSVGSSVNISAPSEQVQPGQGLDVRGSASESIHEPIVLPPAEGAQRNFCRRLNPSRMHQPIIPPMFSTVDAARQSFVSSYRQSRRIPTDPSLDIRSAAVADNASAQNPSFVNRVPNLPQNMQSFRLNVGSSSRVDSSSSSILSGDRDDVPREGHQSRSMARNLLDHHMFVRAPELRAMARNPTNRGLGTGNTSVSGNVASTYRGGSSSGTNASSAPTWVAHPNSSSQYPRRWSELVRRSSMSSSIGAEPGGNVNHSLLASGLPTSPQEMLLSSGVANQGHHRQYPRPMSWLERHEVGLAGIPHSLRTLAAASEGRSRRLASELRHVLDLMRRGEHLRLEDVMILDQSVFFGVADIHDPHRDMRLDVDNMSYEELLALEERIGNVSTGLSEETILNHLKQLKYSSTSGGQLGAEPCCICQEEYNDGENFATLKCGHNFHADCIKQWLMQKNLCPICKTTGLTK
ncbi:probable E3 ubiquitin-protein ligase RHG1A [Hibiscus syriacus]|uniref:probable E3 ubiquitin-protein ligase RHG1A n=1 Tax=Hibiscus syriacus TaxID=106335 RepID=UPI0019230869|nr:probable E3 ubiquitin-protein ligase RHG1A [Hibiscus syriacus]XP_039033002.1 probable E3 ubiquitin-protein ligase RHG1A [Hibiscus syriacus]XP_039033003.1 probable E3 ubiquitin-protein ligase RHG1A [Hibiscus syriacus]XP_039033004.1 probable E3 ubiquitin-protein ligase RHG1A [Hibiscus syriacus]XP_039033005.1 probable E3 ubiquitin-protein ligase RHG1A [Hibiscus syriacus]